MATSEKCRYHQRRAGPLQLLLDLCAPGKAGEKLGGQDGGGIVAWSETQKFPAADRLGRASLRVWNGCVGHRTIRKVTHGWAGTPEGQSATLSYSFVAVDDRYP